MKILIAAVLLSSLSAPVLALEGSLSLVASHTTAGTLTPTADEFGRRSGHCPKRATTAREGAICGGV